MVWKIYFENLRAIVTTKEAEVSLANKQVEYWREKAGELEKRSPEAVERVLAERISIRETEIVKLRDDREHGFSGTRAGRAGGRRYATGAGARAEGFREMLAMEEPSPGDPDYQEYLDYLEGLCIDGQEVSEGSEAW
ncbi:MAG: hypothetical protein QM747_21735 [Nocardioides sp.]